MGIKNLKKKITDFIEKSNQINDNNKYLKLQ